MARGNAGEATVTITGKDGATMPTITAAALEKMAKAVEAELRRGKPRMKPDAEFDRAADATFAVAADELRQFIERYERLEAEKADLSAGQKEVMAEAKGRGYDTRVMRKVIALRKRDEDEVAEEAAVLEMYLAALGMR